MQKNPIQVLAEILPNMMQAVLTDTKYDKRNALGGITSQIAKYLNAEICSIFCVNETGEALILTEAHGYHEKVIGEKHDSSTGLTGRIYSDGLDLILNYCVQDKDLGWAGRFDPELQSHCWSLLGVPIKGAEGKIHGVLKFENKRNNWSTLGNGRYLTSIIPIINEGKSAKRICTPKFIMEYIQSCEQTKADPQIYLLAKQLVDNIDEISFLDSKRKKDKSKKKHSVNTLSNEFSSSKIQSIKWISESLHHSIDQLYQSYPSGELRTLQELTHSFRMSLNIYLPFGLDDYHLAQALGQIIGMALDARETANIRALEMVRHGIKSATGSFLGQVDLLMQEGKKLDGYPKINKTMGLIYTAALNLTSSCSMASKSSKKAGSHTKKEEKFETLYASTLISQFDYFQNYLSIFNISFSFPEKTDLSTEVSDTMVDCDMGLIAGVLDGLIVNIVRHSNAKNVNIWFIKNPSNITLCVEDDGIGIGNKKINELNEDKHYISFSESGGFGIKAYKSALTEIGYSLDINNKETGGVIIKIHIPIYKSLKK